MLLSVEQSGLHWGRQHAGVEEYAVIIVGQAHLAGVAMRRGLRIGVGASSASGRLRRTAEAGVRGNTLRAAAKENSCCT
ncbi:g11393 [Coccomyxa elongata]